MAQSGSSRECEIQHSPFVNFITGKKIETEPWPVTKSSCCTSDAHFEKLTKEMKRLSVAQKRQRFLPPLGSAHGPQTLLCAPSPLENSPLTGKKISIHQKNNHETMWRPSEAEPENMASSFLGYCLPRAKPSTTRYRYKSWCQFGREPVQELLGSECIEDYLTIQGSRDAYEPQVCTDVVMSCGINTQQDSDTFYPEPGLAWAVMPCANTEGTRSVCTVSGHEPVRVRLRGEAPILSVFHQFQTELLFDRESSEVLIAEQLPMEVGGSCHGFTNGEFAVAPSMKGSEGTDAVYSNLSTGHSTVTNCYRQLLDDIQEQSHDAQDDYSSRSRLSRDAKVNTDWSCTSELSEKHESLRMETPPADKDEGDDCVTGTSMMPEVWILESDGELEAIQIPRIARCSNSFHQTFMDACSESLTESGTFFDANESWEKIRNIQTKLKRPPQTAFKFSKIDVHHIQSENRRSVMRRLTKLPNRCQKVAQSSYTNLQDCCRSFPSLISRNFSHPEKGTAIATINLELDVNVTENKHTFPLPAPNARLLKRLNPTGNKDLQPGDNITVRGAHHVINKHPTWSRTQFVFVGKGVFNGSGYKPSNCASMSPHTNDIYTQASSVSNADANSGRGQIQIYVSRCESPMDTSSTFSGQEKQANNQEGATDKGSSKINAHVSGHKDNCNRQINQGRSVNVHGSLGVWDTVAQRRSDSASDMQQSGDFNRRQKEDRVHHFSFRSASTTAFSVTSLDDVPYNSPVESPCRYTSPAGDYINDIVDDQNPDPLCQTDTMYHIDAEDDSDESDSCPRRLDVLPSGIGFKIDNNGLNVGPVLHENVSLEKKWTGGDKLMHTAYQGEVQDIGQQEHEDDTVISDSSIDLSARSHDSVFFDFDEDIQSGKLYSTSKLTKQPREGIGSTVSKSECVTEVSQHSTKTTFGESSALQQVSLSTTEQSLDPKITELSMTADASFLDDYISSDTRRLTLTEELPKQKINATAHQEPVGPVYKNVRFADVDKVISFTVPDMSFPVPVTTFKGLPELRTTKYYDGPQSSNPVLHKQTLQLRACLNPKYRQNQLSRRRAFGNDAYKFIPNAHEPLKSHCLRDLKWSANSYRNRYPRPSCMFIKGTGLEVQGVGSKSRDHAADSQGETSVMYTICQKCEDELHVKFGSRCQLENDSIVLQKVVGSICKGEERSGEVRDTELGGMRPTERLTCRHKQDGCCNLCNKIMSWTSSEKKNAVQGK